MPDSTPLPVEAEPEAPERDTAANLRTIFTGGLLALALLASFYFAAEIVLPIVLAFVLSAVFQPPVRFLTRFRVPRVAASLLIVLGLVALVGVLGLLLSTPIADWVAQLPHTLPKIQQRLHFLGAPITSLQNALKHIAALAPGSGQPTVAVEGTPMAQRVLENMRVVAAGAFTTLLVLFFVLIAGEQFLRRLVDILPDFKRKRQAVVIANEIERDISIYLATVTTMNAIVGVATAGMTWLCGLGDPLLWGTAAFLLNFVPILGPTAGVLMFLVAGLVAIDPLWAAFMPALFYLLIHLAEGETITPMLLAARFTLNPVLITLGVIFWYWMWGVVGAILSTPLLAIAKIVCDRIESLQPVGHFIGGEPILQAGNGKAAP